MPEIVNMCFNSWVRNNPTWEVVFLDNHNLYEYIDFRAELGLERKRIPLQAQSDIIRVNLLKKYGGVWVDSTCYCNKTLGSWLPEKMGSGFFAFNRPNTDRMISSWFLAANPNNNLIHSYCNGTNAFWLENPPKKVVNRQDKKSLLEYITLKLFASNPAIWHNPFVRKQIRFSHYFWFHYLFEYLYLKDSQCKSIWDQTPKISANIPHKLMHFGLSVKANEEIKNEIENPAAPFYKLNWRVEPNQDPESTLNILINKDKLRRASRN